MLYACDYSNCVIFNKPALRRFIKYGYSFDEHQTKLDEFNVYLDSITEIIPQTEISLTVNE